MDHRRVIIVRKIRQYFLPELNRRAKILYLNLLLELFLKPWNRILDVRVDGVDFLAAVAAFASNVSDHFYRHLTAHIAVVHNVQLRVSLDTFARSCVERDLRVILYDILPARTVDIT